VSSPSTKAEFYAALQRRRDRWWFAVIGLCVAAPPTTVIAATLFVNDSCEPTPVPLLCALMGVGMIVEAFALARTRARPWSDSPSWLPVVGFIVLFLASGVMLLLLMFSFTFLSGCDPS
jgi:hypothetical protein